MLKIEQGMKFGRWTILQFNGYKNHSRQWLCKCDCGTEKIRLDSTSNPADRHGGEFRSEWQKSDPDI